MILTRKIAVEIVKMVRFLHVDPGEFSDYMWNIKEREVSKIPFRLSAL